LSKSQILSTVPGEKNGGLNTASILGRNVNRVSDMDRCLYDQIGRWNHNIKGKLKKIMFVFVFVVIS
jgi:hypothetical protein